MSTIIFSKYDSIYLGIKVQYGKIIIHCVPSSSHANASIKQKQLDTQGEIKHIIWKVVLWGVSVTV